MASLVTKFFTTHVGKDVGNAQFKGQVQGVVFLPTPFWVRRWLLTFQQSGVNVNAGIIQI
jgi:hypothetical protein